MREEIAIKWLPLDVEKKEISYFSNGSCTFVQHLSVIRIQNDFRRQPWEEVYENIFKDALPFLKEYRYLMEHEMKQLVSWSVVCQWIKKDEQRIMEEYKNKKPKGIYFL